MNVLKVKKNDIEAIIPRYATKGAACFDLHAIWGGEIAPCGGTCDFRTGLSFEIPEGYVMKVYSRSGHGFKNGIRLVNSVGIVDSDYRGEVMVKLRNDSYIAYTVRDGDRVAQAMIVPAPIFQIMEVESLGETERGTGGFGSTGK
ncbi:MAG: dUTP diphosphatase [Rhodocyclaceae bacterium]|nr:dUTP diphosphatase [Rhodocyclaceae bacterium]